MRDAIVIGSGGGGAVIGKELAARGLDVLLLEAGARNADPQSEWTHYDNHSGNISTGFLRWGPADRRQPPWLRDIPSNLIVQQVSGVGGTTLHYFGNSPRAMPGVFLGYDGPDRNAYDAAHRFPFTYRELIPYYEWVEYTLPVQTAAMGAKEEVFLRAAGLLGLPVQTSKDITTAAYRPQENAILQPAGTAGTTSDPSQLKYPQAQGCTFCGHCHQGCYAPLDAPRNLRAKRSVDNSYVPMALTADRWTAGKAVTLITDAFVTKIHAEGGVARRVAWRVGASGARASEEARVIVLAAGAVESPRLWLNSGLPDPNGWVGRGLTDHSVDVVAGLLPFAGGATYGPGSAARADFPGHGAIENVQVTPAWAVASAAFSDAGIAGCYSNGAPGGLLGADRMGRLVGTDLKDYVANLDRVLAILVITDDDVEMQNRVTLSSTLPADAHGAVPRIEVFHRQRSARTFANREYLVEQAVRLVRAAGATSVLRVNTPPYLLHIHSTMRMGISPADSVAEASGEARAVRRLFLADNAVLANSLGGVNPTLTTQAVATRTAERIFQKYFGGSPWVGKESPVSSIDPAVTKAVTSAGLRRA